MKFIYSGRIRVKLVHLIPPRTRRTKAREHYRITLGQPRTEQLLGTVVVKCGGDDPQLNYADGTQFTLDNYYAECRAGAFDLTLASSTPEGYQLNAAFGGGVAIEDATLTASGQLRATEVQAGATQTWSVQGAANGTYGSLALNSATGQWTYTLNNSAAAVQALAGGETHNQFVGGQSYTDSFTVATANGTSQVVTVTIAGTNDAPVVTSAATASFAENGTVLCKAPAHNAVGGR